MISKQRLTIYCEALRAMREGKFAVEIDTPLSSPPLVEFEIELIKLGAWLELRFEEFSKLQEITADISEGNLLDDVLERTYITLNKVIPYDRIGCALLSDDGLMLHSQWAKTRYASDPRISKGYSSALAGSSLEAILSSGQPRIINDLEAYLGDHPSSESTRQILAEGVRSSLTCPLIAEGKPIGFLFFSSCEKNTYHHHHKKTFSHIARQVSCLIEKSRLYQRINALNQQLVTALNDLKEQSTRDALTLVMNRGAVMDFLHNSLQHAQRQQSHLAVVMADLDCFKAVNDGVGHLGGDHVLQAVVSEMKGSLRSYDGIGRFGGEEFLLVLVGADAATALEIAERIRQRVATTAISYRGQTIPMTLSMGVANRRIGGEDTLERLTAAADEALYQAKRSGRNRVVAAPL